jgi:hypothetical protein
MPKVSIQIPAELNKVMAQHPEVNWNIVISNTLWNYAKKIKLLDAITSNSRLTDEDIESLDHVIKADILKKYQAA